MTMTVVVKTMVGDASTKMGASYITMDVNSITQMFTVKNTGWGGTFSSDNVENAVIDYKRAVDDEINKRLGSYKKNETDT